MFLCEFNIQYSDVLVVVVVVVVNKFLNFNM
jgi:hypothetical protein